MTFEDLPQDSRTYAAARQAFNHEYMVPIDAAWQLEQELADARALHQQAMEVLDNTQTAIGECIKLVEELRK